MPDNSKKIKGLISDRSKLIGQLLDRLEGKVMENQRHLLDTVLADFLDGMETDEDGNIKNSLFNKRRIAMFDRIFTRFASDHGLELVKTLADGVGQVVDFNQKILFGIFKTGYPCTNTRQR
jgi:hypothetical protein